MLAIFITWLLGFAIVFLVLLNQAINYKKPITITDVFIIGCLSVFSWVVVFGVFLPMFVEKVQQNKNITKTK